MPAKPLNEAQLADAARLKVFFESWQQDQFIATGKKPSQESAGETMGYDQSTISQYLRGNIPLNKEAATKFALRLGVPVIEFSPDLAQEIASLQRMSTGMDGDVVTVLQTEVREKNPSTYNAASDVETAPDFTRAPRNLVVVGQVQAGPDGLLHIDDYPVGQGSGTVPYWARCPEAYALRIRGESMSPRYLPGEFVAVDPCTDVLPNNEVIVILVDGRRMIKRMLWQNDDQICLESINKNFQNIIFEKSEVERLHKVLGGVPAEAFKPNN